MVLLFFHQVTLANDYQKYRSLSLGEKQSACESVLTERFPNAAKLCGAEPESERGFLQRAFESLFSEDRSDDTELLLIERRRADKSDQAQGNVRAADVFTYDYQTDTLNHTIINLSSGAIMHSENVQDVQLPLTEKEIDRSRNIATDNLAVQAMLEKEYLMITGQHLPSLEVLSVKAFIFRADSMPGQVNEATKSCGMHRCARLIMHTESRIALETAPIIDLSTGVVTQLKTAAQ